MIRIFVEENDGATAVFLGGKEVIKSHKSFIVEAPDLEGYLRASPQYVMRAVIGAELINEGYCADASH